MAKMYTSVDDGFLGISFWLLACTNGNYFKLNDVDCFIIQMKYKCEESYI